ncbi:MAG: hypothetical protein Q8K86_00635 [Candidatus Nanopelagicaceae bacterium]|nr:hypothetical protein [Candidatus Nanopelagicaceae bacterium]
MGATTSRKKILVYSDDSTVRAAILNALGKRVSADLPEHDISEFATADALRAVVDASKSAPAADLIILDAEAVPEGGMGVSRQFKDEVFQCPPVLLITARPDDAWLAAWSRADATVLAPIDPFTFANVVAGLLRTTLAVHAQGATH